MVMNLYHSYLYIYIYNVPANYFQCIILNNFFFIFFIFFLRDSILKKTLFEKLQYLKQEQSSIDCLLKSDFDAIFCIFECLSC